MYQVFPRPAEMPKRLGPMDAFLLALESGMGPAALGRCLPQLTTASVVLVWPSTPELEVPGVEAGECEDSLTNGETLPQTLPYSHH